jgi:hypothetical protein
MRLIKEQNAAKSQLIRTGLDNIEVELDENFQIVIGLFYTLIL